MRIVIQPVMDSRHEIDITRCLISAVAYELWQRYGGNDELNWLEAERHLEQIVGRSRASDAVFAASNFADRPRTLQSRPGTSGRLSVADSDRPRTNVRATAPKRVRTRDSTSKVA